MNEYRIGDKINARLSQHYIASLDHAQQYAARTIIRGLKRTCEDGCCAEGRIGGKDVEVLRGRRFIVRNPDGEEIANGWMSPISKDDTPSVGECVAEAMRRGLKLTGQSGEGQGDGEQDDQREDEAKPKRKPRSSGPEGLLEKIHALRAFVTSGGEVADVVGTRSVVGAAKMHYAGLSDMAILSAITLTWPDTARAKNGIKTPDLKRETPKRRGDVPVVDGTTHEIYPYVDALMTAGVAPLVIGPAGTGKGVLARQLAEARGLPFRSVPLTEGASVAWLLGRHTPNGYVEAPFIQAFRDGGVFLFDEIDAGDPNMLIVVNDALANHTLDNPLTGEVIERHEDFFPMAAANTYGTGADGAYTGRNRLDAATLDRWRMGRVEMDYDLTLERQIMGVV